MMDTQKKWSLVGLFVIALVVSMPFYVADVYAVSVSVVKNEGQDGMEGYLDAEGDVWTVEAQVTGAESVAPEDMTIKLGQHEAKFGSCSESDLGVNCEYISPLDGGIAEGSYDFDVVFDFLDAFGLPDSASDSAAVIADGSGPIITFKSLGQEERKIKIDFTVEDVPTLGAGLEKIEVIDGETGGLLQEMTGFEVGDREFSFDGVLDVRYSGEGNKVIKIRATDRLGHTSMRAKNFAADFEAPEILDNINFSQFGDFIGVFEAKTDMMVWVREEGDYVEARAYSEQTELDGHEVICEEDEAEAGLWVCLWEDVEVDEPAETISVKIEAEDEAGNVVEETLSKSFVTDDDSPKIVFFGTERVYDDESYIKTGGNRIILRVDERGAGIDEEGIRANLREVGGGASEKPTCEQTEDTYDCYWEINYRGSSDRARIWLSHFKDKVGNEGLRPEVELQVDDTGPRVEKAEIYGLSEAGKKDYFQSNDMLLMEMKIAEYSGLLVLVDLNDVVMDAETKYPENRFTEEFYPSSGWAMFTEEECERKEGVWVCELLTEQIKSGYDSTANLKIKIFDTAGNLASWIDEPGNMKSGSEGNYKFKLLGLDLEEDPDYWEVSAVRPLGGEDDFVDMDTTELVPTRIAMQATLRSDAGAEAGKIDFINCEPPEGFGAQGREILLSGVSADGTSVPKPVLIVEFAPFNSKEYFLTGEESFFDVGELEYKCYFNVYSQIGKKAIKNAEVQEVIMKVPFGFTSLGALNENLDAKVKSAKEGYYESTEWLGTLAKVFQWIGYIGRILSAIVAIMEIYDLISGKLVDAADRAEEATTEVFGLGQLIGKALKGTCTGMQVGEKSSWKFVEYMRVPTQIMSCTPGGTIVEKKTEDGIVVKQYEEASGLERGLGEANWYGKWQRSVLEGYNIWTGRGMLGIPATSLYDNFYISILGLCVPGVVYNLNQLREVHCRRIVCLQKEVPSGIATVEGCDDLFELLECEFWSQPGADLIPGVGVISQIGDMLKSAVTSPAGLINILQLVVCGAICFVQGAGSTLLKACKVLMFFDKALSLIDSIIGLVKNSPKVSGSPYCDMVD